MATSAWSVEDAEAALLSKDGPSYELVDGQLVERHVSYESSTVASLITVRLGAHVHTHKLGRLADSELGMRIFTDPMTTRRADVSFLARARVPRSDQGFLRVPPDLVVQVVSPGDKASEIRSKTDEWLQAGVRLVWVVYPAAREVQVYPAGERPVILGAADEISGGDVVSGFVCTVADFFPE